MPGIVGIIGKKKLDSNAESISRMLECMMHEEFYSSGTHFDSNRLLWIGWINHTGSFSDCMPVWNETRDVCLIFSGEDFQDPIILENLKRKGHNFNQNNASYLVHMYEESGDGFFEQLNGSFCGVLFDFRNGRDNRIILFNDRFGLNRVYYHENKSAFYFSSEAKALLRVLPGVRYVDYKGLSEAISCGCVLKNGTLFSGISIIPPGSCWQFHNNFALNKNKYFEISKYENIDKIDSKEYYEKLKSEWCRILPRFFRSNETIAMSLTGGVDCRMILAWACLKPWILPCYTFSGMFRNNEDVKIARRIAKNCGQPHYVLTLDEGFLSKFPDLAEKTVYITDGLMDVTGSADLFVNRLARKIANIRMTGNYGQEILRNSVSFKPRGLNLGIFETSFGSLIGDAKNTYNSELEGNILSFITCKQMPWYHYSRLALESSQLTIRSPFIDKDLVQLAFRKPVEDLNYKKLSLNLIADGNLTLGKIPTDKGMQNKSIPILTLANRILKEITFKLEYLYDYGMPHKAAKYDMLFSTLKPHKYFLGKHKFYHFRIWYRDYFDTFIKEILLDDRTLSRPYLDKKNLIPAIMDHLAGKKNYTSEITCLLTIELLHRNLVEKF